MEELLSCPFCGKDAHVIEFFIGDCERPFYNVGCDDHVSDMCESTPQRAIENYNQRDNKMLEQLLNEIKELKKAKELLELIYQEHGPYGDGKISDKTRYLMQDYFHFNDDE